MVDEFFISAELEAGGDTLYRVLSQGELPAPPPLFQTEHDAQLWIQQRGPSVPPDIASIDEDGVSGTHRPGGSVPT